MLEQLPEWTRAIECIKPRKGEPLGDCERRYGSGGHNCLATPPPTCIFDLTQISHDGWYYFRHEYNNLSIRAAPAIGYLHNALVPATMDS